MSSNYSAFWDKVKKELSNELSADDMYMWVERIQYHNFNNNTNIMQLSVPSFFIKDNVTKYKKNIEYLLKQICNYTCKIEFIVVKNGSDDEGINMKIKNKKTILNNENRISKTKNQTIKENKEELELLTENKSESKLINEDSSFTFESFVVGGSNKFAAEVAKVVAKNPGTSYNPYFIWGDSGLGKTHLIKAILNYIKKHFPSKKVKYVTSEAFSNEYINSIRHNKPEQFRIRYRSLDLLVIDDVQFFAKKEGLQEEMFHTFNALYDAKKQMVFSCDQHINKVKEMSERLKSRFAGGITVDLQSPEYELKMAIIENIADRNSLEFAPEALEFLCSNIGGSIRDLKGAFYDLLAYSSIMKKRNITLEIVKQRLKEKLATRHVTPISINKIIHIVAEYYNLKSADITGRKRIKSVVLARHVAMYISRQETQESTTQIGAFFGVTHASVIIATEKIQKMLQDKTSGLKEDIDIIINRLKSE